MKGNDKRAMLKMGLFGRWGGVEGLCVEEEGVEGGGLQGQREIGQVYLSS